VLTAKIRWRATPVDPSVAHPLIGLEGVSYGGEIGRCSLFVELAIALRPTEQQPAETNAGAVLGLLVLAPLIVCQLQKAHRDGAR
jgi:hypothetical protein